jgi:VWFA-related protein
MRSLAAVLLATAVTASAQISEVIEVRVANVDVVVTDRAGKPITGLTRDDFQLFENGKPQPLTNFYEIRSEATAIPATQTGGTAAPAEQPSVEARQRSIVVFLDSTSIAPFLRNRAAEAIRDSLARLLRPGDDAMVVSWNRKPEVMQPFTSDRSALDRALTELRKRIGEAGSMNAQKSQVIAYANNALSTSRSSRGRYPIAQAYNDSLTAWRAYAESMRLTQKLLLKSVGEMLSTLSGNDRKKVFLFLGGELQERPGIDVLSQIDSMFQGQQLAMAPPVLQNTDLNLSAELRKLAEVASAEGVTMYFIDVGDRQIDDNGARPRDPGTDFLSETNSLMSMALLASTTGGSVFSGSRNYDAALKDLSRDLDSYYSLGYKPSDGPKERTIVVKVSKPGASVRSRQIYAMRSSEEQIGDGVVANMFHEGLKSEFPVTISLGRAEAMEGKAFKVPITITFPSDLTYLPEGDKLVGEYAVFFVTATPDGSLSQIAKQVQTVSFPAAARAEILKKPFTHTATLVVRPGTQSVSVAIADRRGARTGYGKTTFTAQ